MYCLKYHRVVLIKLEVTGDLVDNRDGGRAQSQYSSSARINLSSSSVLNHPGSDIQRNSNSLKGQQLFFRGALEGNLCLAASFPSRENQWVGSGNRLVTANSGMCTLGNDFALGHARSVRMTNTILQSSLLKAKAPGAASNDGLSSSSSSSSSSSESVISV